ncbi:MAG TPA: hypothetical protein VLV48_03065 [Thermoanaerobaculia bacterium]|nr:hypothetical protein [Thermoanaerobaculia bacterium]
MTRMDRILFGDNQFFGVNHMSEERARQQLERFKETSAIIDVLDTAYDLGIRTFMCTTHDRIGDICDHMRRDKARYRDFIYFPCMPYAHKYANSVSQIGALKTIRRFAGGSVLSTLFRGAVGAITRDINQLMRLLVDAEMKRFEGLNTPVIFVQNVVTDLILGMRLHRIFAEFAAHVRRRYGAEAGFITMNVPALLDALDDVGIENPIVCANVNKIEFRMCGGRALYERTIRERRFRPIAMSVFASGAIPPEEALGYVCAQPRIESIVFGASSRENILQTRDLIRKLDARRQQVPAARSVP